MNHSVEAQGYIIISYLEGKKTPETHRFAIQSNWTLKCTEGWFVSVIFNVHTYTCVCINEHICTQRDRATERPFEMTRTYWEAWESSCTRLSLKPNKETNALSWWRSSSFTHLCAGEMTKCKRWNVCWCSQRCTFDKSVNVDDLQEVLLVQWWTDLVHQEPPTDTMRTVHDFTSQKNQSTDPLGWPWVGNALKWGNTSMSVLWHRHSHSVPSQSPAGPSVHWLATALQTGQTRPFTQTSLDSNHLLPRGGNRSSELNPLVSLPTMSPFAHWLWRVNVPLDCSSLMNELLQDHVFQGVIKGRG